MRETATLAGILWVGGLGALGSLARYGVGAALGKLFDEHAWVPTLVINLLGSFGMGVAMALVLAVTSPMSRHPYGLGVTTGFLGGFTTYSAFAYQTVALAERRAYGAFAAYVALTLLGCLVCCAAGLALGRAVAR
jgi:CrcB protein